jgi:hypothetical protein
MATFNENVDINGVVTVDRGWSDWMFLRQKRDVSGGGGFHVHNPWGDSSQPQGAPANNRLEIGYRDGAGRDHWGQIVVHGPTGNVGIGRVDPGARLDVAGDVVVRGDIRLENADCSEEFRLGCADLPEPGSVMVLSAEGSVCLSSHPYDRAVAGVVTGASERPAIRLGYREDAQSTVPLALVGRVGCIVDAREAAVTVGDLLTTGNERGTAMKAVDERRAFGSVLGKALQPLDSGIGVITILVALQ